MKPATKIAIAALARVDWPRTLQRAAVLVRTLRGDTSADIHEDHALELERGAKLHGAITSVMRQASGCTGDPRCRCFVCAFDPIIRSAKSPTIDA